MEDLTLDYLPKHDGIKIYQSKNMFRINTDTTLLGEFIVIRNNDRILDIGTNNGALLIYASLQGRKCELNGIDINKEALEIAKLNMKENNLNADFFNIDGKVFYDEKGFDVIICNPPFFNTKDERLKNDNCSIKNARHEEEFSLKDMFLCFKRNLKDNGRFYIMHRSTRLNDIYKEMQNVGMRITKLQMVYDKAKKDSIGVLIEGKRSKNCECKVLEPKYIER